MIPAGIDLRRYPSLPSTMDAAAALAHDGAAHGVVVVADEQTAGRGRRGTQWASPAGAGLYFSFLARLGHPKEGVASTRGQTVVAAQRNQAVEAPASLRGPLSLVTLCAGVGVRDGVLAATGLGADLKWPNDLIVGKRKLAGILAEGHAIGTPQQAVIIGVGINIHPAAYPPDVSMRATSLEGELGRAIDSDEVLESVLEHLWNRLALLERSPGDILQAWRAASPNAVGTRVEWDGRHGTTAGIDDSGALLVKTHERVERIIAGELRWML